MVEAAWDTFAPTAENAVFPLGHRATAGLGIGHFPNYS
jgi:hypothetical protein